MTSNEILKIIHDHDLMVRKIPKFNEESWILSDPNKIRDGYILKTETLKNGRIRYIQYRKTQNEYADYYMVKKSKGTGSMISWSLKTDHLAPTLEESINKYLESIKDGE